MAVLSWWSDLSVNSDNERDSNLLNSTQIISVCSVFLEGQTVFSRMKKSNNRSVMPLDVRGCTRATLKESACGITWPERVG